MMTNARTLKTRTLSRATSVVLLALALEVIAIKRSTDAKAVAAAYGGRANRAAPLQTARPSSTTTAATDAWSQKEIWALEDAVHTYAHKGAILWANVANRVPELCHRQPAELYRFYLDHLAAGADSDTAATATPLNEPLPCLEQWTLDDHATRAEGTLTNVPDLGHVHVVLRTAELDADADALSRAVVERWCVCTASGDIFELGTPGLAEASPGAPEHDSLEKIAADGAEQLPAMARDGLGSLARLAAPVGYACMSMAVVGIGMNLLGHHVDVSVFIV